MREVEGGDRRCPRAACRCRPAPSSGRTGRGAPTGERLAVDGARSPSGMSAVADAVELQVVEVEGVGAVVDLISNHSCSVSVAGGAGQVLGDEQVAGLRRRDRRAAMAPSTHMAGGRQDRRTRALASRPGCRGRRRRTAVVASHQTPRHVVGGRRRRSRGRAAGSRRSRDVGPGDGCRATCRSSNSSWTSPGLDRRAAHHREAEQAVDARRACRWRCGSIDLAKTRRSPAVTCRQLPLSCSSSPDRGCHRRDRAGGRSGRGRRWTSTSNHSPVGVVDPDHRIDGVVDDGLGMTSVMTRSPGICRARWPAWCRRRCTWPVTITVAVLVLRRPACRSCRRRTRASPRGVRAHTSWPASSLAV
jgi:hypothetical protein